MSIAYRIEVWDPVKGYGPGQEFETLDEARTEAEWLVEIGYKHVHVTRVVRDLLVTYEPALELNEEIANEEDKA